MELIEKVAKIFRFSKFVRPGGQMNWKYLTMQSQFFTHLFIWTAAILTGLIAVLYAKLITWVQGIYFHWFSAYPFVFSLLGVPLFC